MKSYLIDTNYILRLLLKDESQQFKKAYDLFSKGIQRKAKLIITTIVFFELYWVLSSFYNQNKGKCMQHLEHILSMHFLEIENRAVLTQALTIFSKQALDLEDCYNIAYYQHHSIDELATFDKKLLKVLKR